jgi:hypothetical protein
MQTRRAYNKAIISDSNCKTMTASIAFGCRKPGTNQGSWAGAFVYVEAGGNRRVSAFFQNNMDFIRYPRSIVEGLQAYKAYMDDEGWIPMTPTDITDTSGVIVDGTTASYADIVDDTLDKNLP